MGPGFLSSEVFALVPVQQSVEEVSPGLSARCVSSIDMGAKGFT